MCLGTNFRCEALRWCRPGCWCWAVVPVKYYVLPTAISLFLFMRWMSIDWATQRDLSRLIIRNMYRLSTFWVAHFMATNHIVYLNISFTDKDSCLHCDIALLCPSFLLSLLRLSIDDAFPIILARNLWVCDWNDFVFSAFIDGNFLHFAPNNFSRNFPSSSFNLNVSVIDV